MRKYAGLRLSGIRDPELLAVFADLDRHLKEQSRFIADAFTVDAYGRALVRGGALPRQLTIDPTTKSTYGRLGELAGYDGGVYVKHTSDGIDTNWALVGP